METKTVSFIKAITYRIFGSLITFLGCYIFTGKATVSAAVSVFDFIFKIIVFYVHERVWEHIKKKLDTSSE
jgi:uncharacterized membrane protein